MIQDPQDRPTPKPDRRSKSFDLILFLSLACFKEIGIVDETVFPKYFKLLNTFSLGVFNEACSGSKIILLP